MQGKKQYMLEIIKRKVTYYVTSKTKSFTPVESFCIILLHLKIMSLNNVIDCFVCLTCLKCMITRCSHPGCTKTFSEKQNWKRHEQRSHNQPFKV